PDHRRAHRREQRERREQPRQVQGPPSRARQSASHARYERRRLGAVPHPDPLPASGEREIRHGLPAASAAATAAASTAATATTAVAAATAAAAATTVAAAA